MALYQDIYKVPGLSGSSFQRQQQYYQRLGSPMGAYSGSLQQNNYLGQQLGRNNFGGTPTAPAPQQQAAAPQAAAPTPLANQFASMAGADNVYKGPVFSDVLPFYKAWDAILPSFQQEAQQQVMPGINRDYMQNSRNFYNNLANTGGGSFGRAAGGIGNIQADSQRNATSQMLDWTNNRRQGFQDLFYNPSETAFNRATQLGQTPNTPTVPTYNDFMSTYKPLL